MLMGNNSPPRLEGASPNMYVGYRMILRMTREIALRCRQPRRRAFSSKSRTDYTVPLRARGVETLYGAVAPNQGQWLL